MLTCISCGAENREGARFCDSCGATLAVAPQLREQRSADDLRNDILSGSLAPGDHRRLSQAELEALAAAGAGAGAGEAGPRIS